MVLASCTDNNSHDAIPEEPNLDQASGISVNDTTAGRVLGLDSIQIQTITLQLKPKESHTFRVRLQSLMQQDSMLVSRDENHNVVWSVDSVATSGKTYVTLKLKRVKVDVSLKNLTTGQSRSGQHYDSDDSVSKADAKQKQFTSLIDAPIQATLTPNGSIVGINGTHKLASTVVAEMEKIEDRAPPEMEERVAKDLQRMLEAQIFEPVLHSIFIALPDSGLKPGFRWERTHEVGVNTLVTSFGTFVYRIVEVREVKGRRIATIEANITGKIEQAPTPGLPPDVPKPEIKIAEPSVSGTMRGMLDLSTGILVHSKMNLLVNCILTLAAPNAPPRKIKQKQELTYTVDLIR